MARQVPLVQVAEDYFALRRKLGYRPRSEREEVLSFARHVDRRRTRHITLDMVVGWARSCPHGGAKYIGMRYEAVRRFLAAVASTRLHTPVLPSGYMGRVVRRLQVHVYTSQELGALLDSCSILTPTHKLRPHTFRTLLGLMAATGIRVGEALALDCEDVALDEGLLLIRRDKSGCRRELPIDRSTVDALDEYSARRRERHPSPRTPAFFLTESRATRVQYPTVNMTFRHLRKTLGWKQHPLPRVHDLRHTFAVNKFLEWMRAGKDVDAELPALSAYLGHKNASSTYWYLSAVPELQHLVTGNLEQLQGMKMLRGVL